MLTLLVMSERFALGRYERRKCMSKDMTLLEEIAEQDLERRSGGAASLGSWVLGDPDFICTWTLECQNNCR